MKISNILFGLFLIFCSCQSIKKTNILLENGVSKELAVSRKKQVKDVVYKLTFEIPKTKSNPIPAQLILNFKVEEVSQDLYLDFNEKTENIKSVTVNSKSIAVVHEKKHIVIPAKFLLKGENVVDIGFIAGNSSLNRNDDYLYTLLVPDRASTLFPCFDQPDIKASYYLTLTAPKEWLVLAGAPINKKVDKGEFVQYQFAQTDKMSTYLFSFVAGNFKSITKTKNPFDMTMLYRENNVEKINASLGVIFDLHTSAIGFFEEYTKYPFPFKKLDFAVIPGFQFGGMEHVGAIQYKESSLFLDENATDNEKIVRAKLIAHETAHMWFGDLVTMKWFDDVWMKEVFANFMADKMINPVFPKINHDLKFMTTHYPSAYSEDRTAGTHPIKQKLDNLKDAGSLYGSIIYNKAPIMMRQLEAIMGKDAFQKGIQKYIRDNANDNADWENLIAILDTQTSLDLKQWSEVWVNKSGRPVFETKIEYDTKNQIKNFKIEQQAEDGSANVWPQLFELGLVYNDTIKVFKVSVQDKITNLNAIVGLPKPNTFIYNYNGFGYGVFPIDNTIINYIPFIKDEVARAYSYINLYENTLIGKLSPELAFSIYLKGIKEEKNELIIGLLSNEVSILFWKYLTVNQQEQAQKKLQELVYLRLQEKLPVNIKKTLFRLFQGIAYSESGKTVLYQIWNKEVNIPDLKLNEEDYIKIATNLAIFKHEKAQEILSKTQMTISNPDKLKQFIYLLPSLSEDEGVRNDFMKSLSDEQNREKELWVQLALLNIHHPLRQESAQKHLKFCLDMLEEIQRTGSIFFPKDWLTSSIGNYSSQFAFQVVEDFLKENPNYNPILKRKLLQSVDDLYRAQTLKKE